MKLLTPQGTQDIEGEQISRSILRVQELMELEKEWRLKLAKSEAEFNEMLAKNRKIWEEEETKHEQRVFEMQQEIIVLQEEIKRNVLRT